jgi:hypothetical protein
MATVVELPKEAVSEALKARAAQMKRAANTSPNKLVSEIYEKDAREIEAAITSLKETK